MAEVRFYHLQRARLEDVLPVILERAYERKHRILLLAASEERIQALNALLWTYKPESFLPHGTAKEGDPDLQPIYLSTEATNLNHADLLVVIEGVPYPNLASYQMVVDIFDGNDEDILRRTREKWKNLKGRGHRLIYYQQTPSGKWEEQAKDE